MTVTKKCVSLEKNLSTLLSIVCIKLALLKILGMGIVTCSAIVKLPQIIKIVRSGNARGLSLFSTFLDIFAATSVSIYGFYKHVPFSKWSSNTIYDSFTEKYEASLRDTALLSQVPLIQIYLNFNNKSTGNLSAITTGLIFIGSFVRFITVLCDNIDTLYLINVTVLSFCNGMLFYQIIHYWNKKS
ncbi:Mannose-P-dolichol utilization defect 1 protein [Intoshia linei]|uniref:Mannose-P-dolichol utilization defect 1 protein n=1 Tax=Intoshia linei TaxID=1819745 RepID=A0A177B471_9BILA|nr:Mannose-P-dolichol utilization defect 1 protein [Intoshia linei]